MTRVIIGAADQSLAQQVQASLREIEDTEVAAIAATSDELVQVVLREDADVVLLHEDLGPEPVLLLLRDLSVRRPASAMLLMATEADADLVTEAMEAGARGLVQLPLSFGQLEGRLLAAATYSRQMRRIFAGGSTAGRGDDDGRARVVLLAGAKGGVGTTTVATHLALDVTRSVDSLDVCLVDLDLEKGDVPGILEVRHRVGVADLAKVADDLSPGTIADVVSRHETGVDLLLAPLDVRDVEAVTPRALRQVVAALRRQYDLVIIDAGAHVTPVQATAVEVSDEIVVVATPDVAAMRGMRRLINAWESLGVCKETDVRILVNRTSKQTTVSMETVRQLTRASVLPVGLQSSFRRLEPTLNARNPLELRHPQWWSDLREVGKEIGLLPQAHRRRPAGAASPRSSRPAEDTIGPAATEDPAPGKGRGGLRARRRRHADDGVVTVELLGLMPLFGLVAITLLYVAMIGAAYVVHAHTLAQASRAYAIAGTEEAAQDAARAFVPAGLRDEVVVELELRNEVRSDPETGIDTVVIRPWLVVTMALPVRSTAMPGLPDSVSGARAVGWGP